MTHGTLRRSSHASVGKWKKVGLAERAAATAGLHGRNRMEPYSCRGE